MAFTPVYLRICSYFGLAQGCRSFASGTSLFRSFVPHERLDEVMDLALLVDVLNDSVGDTLELVPFLFITYLAMEALEHSAGGATERLIKRAGKAGPLVGGLLGALPQCGFSAMASTLYAGRLITVGTLVAVILSTSDELVPVFVANQAPMGMLVLILALKVLIGVSVGFAVDVVLRALHRTGDGHPHIQELCQRAHCGCAEIEAEGVVEVASGGVAKVAANLPGSHGASQANIVSLGGTTAQLSASTAHHAHAHDGHRWFHIVRSALVHTLQVTFFIFVITFAFGLGLQLVGEDAIGALFSANPVLATLLAGLVGLIPNCGASVAIAELFLDGTLGFGPMLAGLLVSGGVGLLVLYRTNNDLHQNLIITLIVYAVGVGFGLLAGLV